MQLFEGIFKMEKNGNLNRNGGFLLLPRKVGLCRFGIEVFRSKGRGKNEGLNRNTGIGKRSTLLVPRHSLNGPCGSHQEVTFNLRKLKFDVLH